jgi:hypothetical protein
LYDYINDDVTTFTTTYSPSDDVLGVLDEMRGSSVEEIKSAIADYRYAVKEMKKMLVEKEGSIIIDCCSVGVVLLCFLLVS